MYTAKYPAAFINNIADEGTKTEAVTWLQRTWDDYLTSKYEHERMVGELKKLLDADDLDSARDLVRHEFDGIHGPND